MKEKLRAKVLEAIAAMPVINHHEHARYSFSVESGMEYDLPFFLYFPYLDSELPPEEWSSLNYGSQRICD